MPDCITKEVGWLGGTNVGGFSRPIEQRWSITVHNSISDYINCSFSCYQTSVLRGFKSVLRPHLANGRCGQQSAVLNDCRSAEQCERWPSKHCGWARVGVRYSAIHCRRLWDRASAPINRTFPRPLSSRRPWPLRAWMFAADAPLYPLQDF